MLPRQGLTADARSLARAQSGVLSVGQLRRLGFTYRGLARAGAEWTRVTRGIYLLSPPGSAVPWEARVWAGLLIGGDGSCASHTSAAVLDGLLTLAEAAEPKPWLPRRAQGAGRDIEILVPGQAPRGRAGWTFHRDSAGTHLRPRAMDPARTRVEDTVLDLCADAGEKEVVFWVMRACQHRRTTPSRLLERLAARQRVPHARLIREVLGDVVAGATTELERRALRDVWRAHGLPPAQWQHRTRGGGRIVDAAFPAYGVVIELDGRLGHTGEGVFRDRRRDNAHALLGAVTLRYGWWEICNDPCGCAAEIAAVLRARGCSVDAHPCRACPQHACR